MREYHKIQTIFKRDPETKFKTLLMGDYSLEEFAYLENNSWVYTEKVDGTNIRVMLDGAYISFGGKTDNAQIPSPLVTKLNDLFLIRHRAELVRSVFKEGSDICLYGEGYGAKIQKGGGNYRPDASFVLFDIKIGDFWLKREDVEDIASNLQLEVVPIIGEGPLKSIVDIAKEGFTSKWGDFLAEGIVARPVVELKARNGERIITKIKHKDFKKG